MLHTAIKNLIAHRLRLMATALAVILGVALMAGTLVLTATMQRTFDNLFADVYRGTDAVVRAQATFEGLQNVDTAAQRGRVDASLMTSVQAVSGVAAAEGSISGYARPVGSDGKALGNPTAGGPNLGMNWSDNPKLNTFTLVTGSAPRQDNEVVIDRKSSKDGHLRVGDSATVLVAGPPQRVVISGIARFGSTDSPGGATIVAFRTPVAQRLIGEPGKFDAISLVATPGVSQTLLVERVARVLPTGTEAITGRAITAETPESDPQGAIVPQHVPAGVRDHRAAGRCLHDRQYVLHHGRAADPGERPVAGARSQPSADPHLRRRRGDRDRGDRLAGRSRRRHRRCNRAEGPPFRGRALSGRYRPVDRTVRQCAAAERRGWVGCAPRFLRGVDPGPYGVAADEPGDRRAAATPARGDGRDRAGKRDA